MTATHIEQNSTCLSEVKQGAGDVALSRLKKVSKDIKNFLNLKIS